MLESYTIFREAHSLVLFSSEFFEMTVIKEEKRKKHEARTAIDMNALKPALERFFVVIYVNYIIT